VAAEAPPSAPVKVHIRDLTIDPAIQIRKANREQAILRYMDAIDVLPPVEAIRTPEGKLILYDGFQRTAAHQRLGLDDIRVLIEDGTREEALERAIVANLRHGEPLDQDERDEAIRRLHQLHPQAGSRLIATKMMHSVSASTVERLLDADEVRQAVPFKWLTHISHGALADISAAPKANWSALACAYDQNKWTRPQLQQAVKEVGDESVPAAHRQALLDGTAQPGDHLRTEKAEEEKTEQPAAPGAVGQLTVVSEQAEEEPEEEPEEDEYVGDEPGYDPVGTDVGERLIAVSPFVVIPVRIPSGRPRQRGNRTYQRERVTVQRTIPISVTDEVLDGHGNPNDMESAGWAMLCREVYRQLWRSRPAIWPPDGPGWGET